MMLSRHSNHMKTVFIHALKALLGVNNKRYYCFFRSVFSLCIVSSLYVFVASGDMTSYWHYRGGQMNSQMNRNQSQRYKKEDKKMSAALRLPSKGAINIASDQHVLQQPDIVCKFENVTSLLEADFEESQFGPGRGFVDDHLVIYGDSSRIESPNTTSDQCLSSSVVAAILCLRNDDNFHVSNSECSLKFFPKNDASLQELTSISDETSEAWKFHQEKFPYLKAHEVSIACLVDVADNVDVDDDMSHLHDRKKKKNHPKNALLTTSFEAESKNLQITLDILGRNFMGSRSYLKMARNYDAGVIKDDVSSHASTPSNAIEGSIMSSKHTSNIKQNIDDHKFRVSILIDSDAVFYAYQIVNALKALEQSIVSAFQAMPGRNNRNVELVELKDHKLLRTLLRVVGKIDRNTLKAAKQDETEQKCLGAREALVHEWGFAQWNTQICASSQHSNDTMKKAVENQKELVLAAYQNLIHYAFMSADKSDSESIELHKSSLVRTIETLAFAHLDLMDRFRQGAAALDVAEARSRSHVEKGAAFSWVSTSTAMQLEIKVFCIKSSSKGDQQKVLWDGNVLCDYWANKWCKIKRDEVMHDRILGEGRCSSYQHMFALYAMEAASHHHGNRPPHDDNEQPQEDDYCSEEDLPGSTSWFTRLPFYRLKHHMIRASPSQDLNASTAQAGEEDIVLEEILHLESENDKEEAQTTPSDSGDDIDDEYAKADRQRRYEAYLQFRREMKEMNQPVLDDPGNKPKTPKNPRGKSRRVAVVAAAESQPEREKPDTADEVSSSIKAAAASRGPAVEPARLKFPVGANGLAADMAVPSFPQVAPVDSLKKEPIITLEDIFLKTTSRTKTWTPVVDEEEMMSVITTHGEKSKPTGQRVANGKIIKMANGGKNIANGEKHMAADGSNMELVVLNGAVWNGRDVIMDVCENFEWIEKCGDDVEREQMIKEFREKVKQFFVSTEKSVSALVDMSEWVQKFNFEECEQFAVSEQEVNSDGGAIINTKRMTVDQRRFILAAVGVLLVPVLGEIKWVGGSGPKWQTRIEKLQTDIFEKVSDLLERALFINGITGDEELCQEVILNATPSPAMKLIAMVESSKNAQCGEESVGKKRLTWMQTKFALLDVVVKTFHEKQRADREPTTSTTEPTRYQLKQQEDQKSRKAAQMLKQQEDEERRKKNIEQQKREEEMTKLRDLVTEVAILNRLWPTKSDKSDKRKREKALKDATTDEELAPLLISWIEDAKDAISELRPSDDELNSFASSDSFASCAPSDDEIIELGSFTFPETGDIYLGQLKVFNKDEHGKVVEKLPHGKGALRREVDGSTFQGILLKIFSSFEDA